ncbi:hypothetical protein ZWY2020_008078 [Hordeum vulgare]|uniref:Uncharacterized protein n=2 Tax=Hordeum vulgare subsp. vulgare TaxID=112509 RepID=A0A8I6XRK6_HORVV|nr:hypothetical protein ZWY2020_008078 [Hordeum vulgare]
MVCCSRGRDRPAAGGLLGSCLLIAALVQFSFLGSTFLLAVDGARTSSFMAMAPLPVAMAPSPLGLKDDKRPVPTGSNPLHNR